MITAVEEDLVVFIFLCRKDAIDDLSLNDPIILNRHRSEFVLQGIVFIDEKAVF
jgi:hypothetical protein